MRLSCRTEEQKWFFCLWHSPTEDKQCAIQVAINTLAIAIIIIIITIISAIPSTTSQQVCVGRTTEQVSLEEAISVIFR